MPSKLMGMTDPQRRRPRHAKRQEQIGAARDVLDVLGSNLQEYLPPEDATGKDVDQLASIMRGIAQGTLDPAEAPRGLPQPPVSSRFELRLLAILDKRRELQNQLNYFNRTPAGKRKIAETEMQLDALDRAEALLRFYEGPPNFTVGPGGTAIPSRAGPDSYSGFPKPPMLQQPRDPMLDSFLPKRERF